MGAWFHVSSIHVLAVATAGLILQLIGCGGGEATRPNPPPPPPPSAVASVSITPREVTLTAVGATAQFTATAIDQAGMPVSGVAFAFRSTDESVITVDNGGLATARASGGARVEVEASGSEASAQAVVRAGPIEWIDINAGLIDSCGLTTHGTAYCWGENVHGQVGNGLSGADVPTPEAVLGGILFFERITIGGGHICALSSGRRAHCWGNTFFGEGGFGRNEVVWTEPTLVDGGHEFVQLSAAGSHTCGLAADGSAYCWGVNDRGQLGDGTTTNRNTPVAVAGDHTFVHIHGAPQSVENHTCGVATDGSAYCWGVNSAGELGDGTTTDRHAPVQVGGGLQFASISAGGEHTCALTLDGSAYCWGANHVGQLGDGTTQSSAGPVEVAGGLIFTEIHAGEAFSCGLTTAGEARCWGGNQAGQLGDGTTQLRTAPVPVSGGIVWTRIDLGQDHVCGLATDGTGYCWGSDTRQKLGNGPLGDQSTPQPLPNPADIG